MLKGLNIGCGNTIDEDKDGYEWVGIDMHSELKNVIIRDVGRGLPFSDNTFDIIKADQLLEHIKQEDYIFLWNEIYRVLKPGCLFHLSVPRFGYDDAVQDPTHVRFFCPNSFQYFCDDGTGKTAFCGISESYGVKTLFKMMSHNFHENSNVIIVTLQK